MLHFEPGWGEVGTLGGLEGAKVGLEPNCDLRR